MKRICLSLCLISVLAGCAGAEAYREGNRLIRDGDAEQGLRRLQEAVKADPTNAEYRSAFFRQRELLINRALAAAELAIAEDNFDEAAIQYQEILKQEPQHVRALSGLKQLEVLRRQFLQLNEATAALKKNEIDLAREKITQVLKENPKNRRALSLQKQIDEKTGGRLESLYPKLRSAYRRPVSVSFREAPLSQVLEALQRSTGINFIFDKEVRTDARTTMSVKNKTMEDVLRVILSMHQLEQRVLDDDTVLVYPNTPAKVREYQEIAIRNFYISNADVKQTANLLRTIVKVKDIFVDERLNLIVVRDTPQVIRLAEQVIAAQDLAEPEVMLELEVLEIASNTMRDMGIRWPDEISATVKGAEGVAGQLTVRELQNPTNSLVRLQVNNPLVAAKLKQLDGQANLLANPRVRIRNREKAKVLIGERVPVVTTTTTANVGTAESVNYLDVGLKLELEPTISLDDEVAMRVGLEVSNILETITRASGTQTYRLGTRNASTVLRVRDGETQILAGLIQRDERKSGQRIPYVGDTPLLGRLFSSTSNNEVKTEIVLLITPRIVRNIPTLERDKIEILSGTEAAVGASPIQLRPATSGAPAAMSSPTPPTMSQPTMPPPALMPPSLAPPPLVAPPLVPSSPR
jgi:general secretion pathway protein D